MNIPDIIHHFRNREEPLFGVSIGEVGETRPTIIMGYVPSGKLAAVRAGTDQLLILQTRDSSAHDPIKGWPHKPYLRSSIGVIIASDVSEVQPHTISDDDLWKAIFAYSSYITDQKAKVQSLVSSMVKSVNQRESFRNVLAEEPLPLPVPVSRTLTDYLLAQPGQTKDRAQNLIEKLQQIINLTDDAELKESSND